MNLSIVTTTAALPLCDNCTTDLVADEDLLNNETNIEYNDSNSTATKNVTRHRLLLMLVSGPLFACSILAIGIGFLVRYVRTVRGSYSPQRQSLVPSRRRRCTVPSSPPASDTSSTAPAVLYTRLRSTSSVKNDGDILDESSTVNDDDIQLLPQPNKDLQLQQTMIPEDEDESFYATVRDTNEKWHLAREQNTTVEFYNSLSSLPLWSCVIDAFKVFVFQHEDKFSRMQSELRAVEQQWDEQADEWNRWIGDDGDSNRRESSDICLWKYLGHVDDQVILDAGCGNGYLTVRLAHETRARRIIGVDLSSAMIRIARANIDRRLTRDEDRERVQVHQDSISELNTIENHSIDLIVCNYVLMDMPDLDSTIRVNASLSIRVQQQMPFF